MYNEDPYSRKCPSIYRGIVEDNRDPENLGRCKIRVPSIHGELTYPIDILPWARPIALAPIGNSRGAVNIPSIGDIVWVLFEGSIKDYPVYLGGTYGTGDMEIDNDRVDFYVEGDSSISYDRNTNTYSINIGENNIEISRESISMTSGITNMKISNRGVTIRGDLIVSGSIIDNNRKGGN